MNRWIKALVAVTMVVGAVAIQSRVVSADAVGSDGAAAYAGEMWHVLPQIDRLAAQMDRTLAAAVVKPELQAELADLAKRAEFMVYDLENTEAPAAVADAHEKLVFALRQLNEVGQIGVEDPEGARHLYDIYEPMLEAAGRDIRTWTLNRLTIVSRPAGQQARVIGQ